MTLRRDALTIYRAILAAADAGQAVSAAWKQVTQRVSPNNFDRVFVIAAGKAASAMASAIYSKLKRKPDAIVLLTKYGHCGKMPFRCEVFEAAHPVPDEAGRAAALTIEQLLRTLNARDLVIVALSGGASALLADPAPSVELSEYQHTTDLLLRAGANIRELNTVRKHISMLKGGRLAALAYPATVAGLILSDVIGDPLDVIASGPTAPDPTTFRDAIAVLQEFELTKRAPRSVRVHLEKGEAGKIAETPKPRDLVFEHVYNLVVGSNRIALEAAARVSHALGYNATVLSSTFSSEARELGAAHAEILREVISADRPVKCPACILSGGEPTVTVRGDGKGGRAQEFALAAAIAMEGIPDALILSAGTDGTDGPTDAAGGMVSGETVRRGAKAGLSAREYLERNDSYAFLEGTGDLVKTGPTGTNVMDVNIMLARRK